MYIVYGFIGGLLIIGILLRAYRTLKAEEATRREHEADPLWVRNGHSVGMGMRCFDCGEWMEYRPGGVMVSGHGLLEYLCRNPRCVSYVAST